MNTVYKLNNVLGWLTAMNFDKPELSNDLEEPLNVLSEAISEVENLSLSGVSQQRELLCDQVCDWYSVGHQLNGHQECRTCGKQKAF